jgi:hypothetical protein
MAGLSEEPEGKRRFEEIVAVDETHAAGTHGALDLFLEVVVDAEALEVVDGDHHVPAAAAATLLTLTENISYVRQALLHVHGTFNRVVTCATYCEEREKIEVERGTRRSKSSLRSSGSVLAAAEERVTMESPRWRPPRRLLFPSAAGEARVEKEKMHRSDMLVPILLAGARMHVSDMHRGVRRPSKFMWCGVASMQLLNSQHMNLQQTVSCVAITHSSTRPIWTSRLILTFD